MADGLKSLFFKKDPSPPLYNPSGVYLGFRDMTFGLSKQPHVPELPNGIRAFVYEEGSDDGERCYSLVVASGGATSIYSSDGGGVIGAGRDVDVALLSKELLECSCSFEHFLHRRNDCPLPSPAMIRFYIIKKGAVFSEEFLEYELKEKANPLFSLYSKAEQLTSTIYRKLE